MIRCQEITKAYDQQMVLCGVTQHFADQGFYLLLGESGSGKTTFLNILAGLAPFDSGRVEWDGVAYDRQVDSATAAQSYAYITQDAFYVDFLTVRENLRLVTGDNDAITALLKRFSLEQTAQQLPGSLSGGERQRLALIRALLAEKQVLLLDEPTAALDEQNKRQVFSLLAQLSRDHLIICASHDLIAREYADAVIVFSKCEAGVQPLPAVSLAAGQPGRTEVTGRKENLMPFLGRWFHSALCNRGAAVRFTVFLAFAFVLCLLADLPGHKLEASIDQVYKINYLTVKTLGGLRWEQIAPADDAPVEVVLDYSGSCPDGSEDVIDEDFLRPLPEYEVSVPVLPAGADAFRLSDSMLSGTYFTGARQVILSWEMAYTLYPDDPGYLVGSVLRKNLYGLGVTELEIVGVLDRMDEAQRQYLNGMGLYLSTDADAALERDSDLFFISGELTRELEQDAGFFSGSARQRTYRVYFDSYQAMRRYYDRHVADLTADNTVQMEYSNVDPQLQNVFMVLCCVLLPIAAFMVLFSILFYASLRKTEYVHNSRFVAVFEYAGHDKNHVIGTFIFMNFLQLLKSCAVALAAALLLALLTNLLNSYFLFANFCIFSCTPALIAAMLVFLLVMASLAVYIQFRRVRVSSWYEIALSGRDLL